MVVFIFLINIKYKFNPKQNVKNNDNKCVNKYPNIVIVHPIPPFGQNIDKIWNIWYNISIIDINIIIINVFLFIIFLLTYCIIIINIKVLYKLKVFN